MAGNLTIDAGSGFYMDFGANDMTAAVTVKGNISIIGNLSLSSLAGGDLRLNGDWTRTAGVFTPNNRAVFFQGALANQTLSATGGEIFDFVILNKAAGDLILSNNVTINTLLTLTSGKVLIGTNNLTIVTAGAGIAGASSSNFIITNSSGRLIQNMPNNGIYKIYPVGPSNIVYAPVTIAQSAAGVTDNISIGVTSPGFAPLVNDAHQIVQWSLNEAVAGGNNLSSNFEWPSIMKLPVLPR